VSQFDGQPSTRWSLRGLTEEGDEAWIGGTDHHHWHRTCAEEILVPELGQLRKIPAGESSQTKLERRGRRPSGRRRR
jgi:hypothetical protein